MNVVLVGHYPPGYKLAYYFDWRDAFLALRPRHQVRVINTHLPFRRPNRLFARLPLSWSFDARPLRDVYQGRTPCDLLVYPPSFFYFNRGRRRPALEAIADAGRRRFPTVFFVENEYRLLSEKVDYARAMGAAVLVSQLPLDVAEPFYRARFAGKILSLPAGLNPAVFRPTRPLRARPIDVGTRSHIYPPSPLGDARNALLRAFAGAEGPLRGLRVDISLDQRARFNREDWAKFLNRCKATIGSEAAGRLGWDDEAGPCTWPGVVSSRHFEAMGTMTAQFLLEGRYNDILQPGVHYLRLDRDGGNLSEVAAALRDLALLERIAEAAHELARDGHTYAHRLEALLRAV